MSSVRNEFSGKSVLVTGAGKGIGRAVAVMLAARGATVVAVSRSAEDLSELEAEIGSSSIAVDLADPAATRRRCVRRCRSTISSTAPARRHWSHSSTSRSKPSTT